MIDLRSWYCFYMVYMVYCLTLVFMSWYSCRNICIFTVSLWSCTSNRFNSTLSLLILAALSLRHWAITGKPGYFSSHLSFICFINPLPLLLSSLSIFHSSSFISFVNSLLVLAAFALFVLRFWSTISCWISLVVLGSFISNLNLTALYLRFCVDTLLRLSLLLLLLL